MLSLVLNRLEPVTFNVSVRLKGVGFGLGIETALVLAVCDRYEHYITRMDMWTKEIWLFELFDDVDSDLFRSFACIAAVANMVE